MIKLKYLSISISNSIMRSMIVWYLLIPAVHKL